MSPKILYGLHATHPFYACWYNMLKRCNDPANKAWPRYGGRGITVSLSWQDFKVFQEDMFKTWSPGLELERLDNDKGYSRENCSWVTRAQQCQNTSRTKLSAEKVRAMKALRPSRTIKEIADIYQTSESHCSRVLRGIKWL